MATTPFDPIYTGTGLFDIYSDGITNPQRNAPGLPTGNCNFVDLTPGANGAKCGCRRFWARQSMGSPVQDQAGWCMCNHHACYHEHGDNTEQAVGLPQSFAGQENEPPRPVRTPLSPVVGLHGQLPPMIGAPESFHYANTTQTSLDHHQNAINDATAPGSATPRPSASLPDTLAWGDLAPTQIGFPGQPNQHTLPPIPSQCLIPSDTASTTSSVNARYLRPFSGRGLQTLNRPTGSQPRSPLQKVNKSPNAMPPPPLHNTSHLGSQYFASGPRESSSWQSSDAQEQQRTTEERCNPTLRNLSDTVSGHEQRLDRLETTSFSATQEECAEKHDHMDLRVTELEGKIEEVEKLINDNGAAGLRSNNTDDDAQSIASASTSVASRAVHSQDLHSQLQALQEQVTRLQHSLPSFVHPWEVEVVFLPFLLQGVWQKFQQFRNAQAGGDDWTQMPMTYSTTTLRAQSPFYGDWAAPENEDDWLLPKACGEASIIDKRLRSRGLIRTVSVKGPDARSVQMAIHSVFGDVLRSMDLATCPPSDDPRSARFLGLQSSWVPLRKIHKDSRLRFLSPAEMTTPAMWDVQFLNSVMMRSAQPRLFITHPDAYLQDFHSFEIGWSWHQIRTLTRVYPANAMESQQVPEADALEACWAYQEQLDESPEATPATSRSRSKGSRVSSSPSQQYFPAKQSWSSSSQIARAQSPMLRGLRSARPAHIRTNSFPIPGVEDHAPLSARRRISSGGQSSRRPTPTVRTASQFAVTKRRKARSPSRARLTPRWTMSPSPVPTGLSERHYVRGTTPAAYATPHSNAPLQEMRTVRGGSVVPMDIELPPSYEDDDDFDIQIYESESDADYADNDDENGMDSQEDEEDEMVTHDAQPRHVESYAHAQLPEDEPWPGIEDQELHGSDGENVDPVALQQRSDGDTNELASNASSQPSEYPSTQRAWPDEEVGGGFLIHEDGDAMG